MTDDIVAVSQKHYYAAMIDLHTHSNASDGSLTPTELVSKAVEEEVRYLGLTDHDTTAGLKEAHSAAEGTDLVIVNGIELSAKNDSRTVHIVGLGIDPDNAALQQLITQAQQSRIERAVSIGEKLENAGITDAYSATVTMAGTTVLGRAHFAQMLVNTGVASNFRKVFKRYMVKGKPGYVTASWCTIEKAIETIHGAGGVAILAHPMRYGLSAGQLDTLIERFAAAGGDSLEFISGHTTPKEIARASKFADKYGLSASVGSDFHGPDKPWAALGRIPPLPPETETVWQRHGLWNQ